MYLLDKSYLWNSWYDFYEAIFFSMYSGTFTWNTNLFLGEWCGPNLVPRKDDSEHGISLRIYWSNKIQRKVVA